MIFPLNRAATYTPSSRKLSPFARNRNGFTLTELAIVLCVIGILIAAVWAASQQVISNNKVQQATAQTMQIVAGYKSLYAKYGVDQAGKNDVTCIGVNAGYFPANMIPSGTACTTGTASTYPQTPWAGDSYVAVMSNSAYNEIMVEYMGIPASACMGLMSNLASSNIIEEAVQDVIIEKQLPGGGLQPVTTWENDITLPPLGAHKAYTPSDLAGPGFCTSASNNIMVGFGVH